MGLANLGSELKTCGGSRVRLVGVSISFEKNFYRLPFTPPSLVRRIGPSSGHALPAPTSPAPVRAAGGAARSSAPAPSIVDPAVVQIWPHTRL
jgi:hypothetical protein